MVKPFVLAIGAIPVIFALLIVIPMLTSTDIPTTAINPSDKIQIEFTKHDLRIFLWCYRKNSSRYHSNTDYRK